MDAKVMKDRLLLSGAFTIEGETVLVTDCRDYDHFRTLPTVVEYNGRECGRTGWNSDRGEAYYKSHMSIALVRR